MAPTSPQVGRAVGLGRRRIGRAPVLLAASGLAGAVLLRVRDPHVSGAYGTCPFLALTGLPCPGCGGLRAVNDLTHGDLMAAAGSNLYAVTTLVTLLLGWVAWAGWRVSGRASTWARPSDRRVTKLAILWLLGLVAFGMVRWVPALAVLRP